MIDVTRGGGGVPGDWKGEEAFNEGLVSLGEDSIFIDGI